jgi:hypothetical protein
MQEATGTAQAKYKSLEDDVLAVVRNNVKRGIQWCYDYPLFAYAGAAGVFLLFPAPRVFIARNVFGIFQSQVRKHVRGIKCYVAHPTSL